MNWLILAEHPLYAATSMAFFLALLCYGWSWRSSGPIAGQLGTLWMMLATTSNALLIASRWMTSGQPPFKSFFESMVFLAFCVAAVYLLMEWLMATRIFGALAALGSLSSLVLALSRWDAEIVKLPPALQSGWFIPHVVVYFFGYGALFCATAVSVVQLCRPHLTLNSRHSSQPIALDDLAYRAIRFGFALLTCGLLVGAVWAKDAWGDYWVWDPKENWSLVSWLVYAAYLHLRYLKNWHGQRAAWLAIVGFAVVMFTYLGISLLPAAAQSAHTYQN